MTVSPSIPGIENVSSIMGKFSFSEFSLVREFCFKCKDDILNTYDVEMSLETENRLDIFHIKVVFIDTSEVNIDSFGGGLTQVSGLYIKDISDMGWERKKWKVGDFENSRISFHCNRVEISEIIKL